MFRSSIAILGDRAVQAEANLILSKAYLSNEFELKNVLSRALKCIQMASKHDLKKKVLYINALDYILEFVSLGYQCFSSEEV